MGFHLGQEVDGHHFIVRYVLPRSPLIVDLGALDDQERIELQHVRTVRGIVEHLTETLQIVLRGGTRQSGHDMIADLQTPVPAVLRASADLGGTMATLHARQYPVVQDLDTELHTSGTECHRTFDLIGREHIRTGLHGHPHTSAFGDRVQPLSLLQTVGIHSVQRIEATFDEPFLILRITTGERPAHDDQIDLVRVVSDLIQLRDTIDHLLPGIESVAGGPPGCRLLPGI